MSTYLLLCLICNQNCKLSQGSTSKSEQQALSSIDGADQVLCLLQQVPTAAVWILEGDAGRGPAGGGH